MTKSETATLLAFCAAYDQRTIGDADVLAWQEALENPWVPNITLEETREAVVAWYRETSQRISVADVIKRIKTWRAEQLGRGIMPRRTGVPPTEEYRRARAEGLLERPMPLKERLAARNPEGPA